MRYLNPFLVFSLIMVSFLCPYSLAETKTVPGEIVIKLKGGTELHGIGSVLSGVVRDLKNTIQLKNKSSVKINAKAFATDPRFALIKIEGAHSRESVKTAVEILKQDPRVLTAEPNFIYHTQGALNDPLYDQLWSLENKGQADRNGASGKIGADIAMTRVWNAGITGSSNIKVAVIDTGVDFNHPDLKDNIWTNPGEVPGNGVDDEGNGFIDDVYGWNFVNNTANSNDDHNHGTHCSGVIGGVGNNGQGITGVNWSVSIVSLKFLDASGSGSLAGAIQSIQYATQAGVQVMSNSWSGGGFSQSLYDVIDETRKKGIVFIAAAGNSNFNSDSVPTYPASYAIDNIISVAATNNKDALASFSNYGKKTVHVAAPGVDILSTAAKGTYMHMSGTSMATPHVAGIAALMLSANPGLGFAQVKDILIRSSDPVRGFENKVISGGRVNAYNAIFGVYPKPTRPDPSLWKDYNYSLESAHPYLNNLNTESVLEVPGAKFIRVVFEKIDTEANYDKIILTDSGNDEIEQLSGEYTNYVSEYLVGPKVKINFITDSSLVKYGFKISKVQVIY